MQVGGAVIYLGGESMQVGGAVGSGIKGGSPSLCDE
jgi:hypothetical protein